MNSKEIYVCDDCGFSIYQSDFEGSDLFCPECSGTLEAESERTTEYQVKLAERKSRKLQKKKKGKKPIELTKENLAKYIPSVIILALAIFYFLESFLSFTPGNVTPGNIFNSYKLGRFGYIYQYSYEANNSNHQSWTYSVRQDFDELEKITIRYNKSFPFVETVEENLVERFLFIIFCLSLFAYSCFDLISQFGSIEKLIANIKKNNS
ncbi:MAG: hypothetical protein ABFQ53_04040 [Patescibacteria group bacterium]